MFYRVGGAIALLIVGVLIVVFVTRSHLTDESPVAHHHHHPEELEIPPGQGLREGGRYTPEERRFLLGLARETVEEVVLRNRLPDVAPDGLSSSLTEPKGCFVTLEKNGELRGCIGHIFPREPLYRAVMDNARAAAVSDYRFDPVRADELEAIEIEVSVLSVPQPLEFSSPDELLGKLRPRVDGVVLQIGRRNATYLPQVWEQLPDKEEFLSRLTMKAGLPPSAWRGSTTKILTYQAEAFSEGDM